MRVLSLGKIFHIHFLFLYIGVNVPVLLGKFPATDSLPVRLDGDESHLFFKRHGNQRLAPRPIRPYGSRKTNLVKNTISVSCLNWMLIRVFLLMFYTYKVEFLVLVPLCNQKNPLE